MKLWNLAVSFDERLCMLQNLIPCLLSLYFLNAMKIYTVICNRQIIRGGSSLQVAFSCKGIFGAHFTFTFDSLLWFISFLTV